MEEWNVGDITGRDGPGASRRAAAWAHADLAAALLDSDGGAGAELRGHVPATPRGVVVVLHGGAEDSLRPVTWWRLPVLRMAPLASAITRRGGDDLAVLRLKYRVRGWNGRRQDPVVDARWALDRIRGVLPGAPVALVGHSMGGRVALRLVAQPGVAAVAALAPWIEDDAAAPPPGTPVLLMHGTRDRMTDPRRTEVLARRYASDGADVTHVRVEGESHAMLHSATRWHDSVARFVTRALVHEDPPS